MYDLTDGSAARIVEKSQWDNDVRVFAGLHGIKSALEGIRRGERGAADDLIKFYRALPSDIARRLSLLPPGTVEEAGASGEAARVLAGDDVYQQVTRAEAH